MSLALTFYRWLTRKEWAVGFCRNSLDEIMQREPLRITLLKHGEKGRWFADPFILETSDAEIKLLVEDFSVEEKQADIAELTIDANDFRLKERKTVLREDVHLSFPFILEKDGRQWVLPEQSHANALRLYAFENGSLKAAKMVMKKAVADAAMIENEDGWRLYCTELPDYNGKILSIYRLDKNFDRCQLEKTVEFEQKTARMAGDFFTYKGETYRPAQFSDKHYGEGVSIQKMTNDGDFQEVVRLHSNVKGWEIGLHTFNVKDNYIVVDVCRFVHPKIGALIYNLVHLFYHRV